MRCGHTSLGGVTCDETSESRSLSRSPSLGDPLPGGASLLLREKYARRSTTLHRSRWDMGETSVSPPGCIVIEHIASLLLADLTGDHGRSHGRGFGLYPDAMRSIIAPDNITASPSAARNWSRWVHGLDFSFSPNALRLSNAPAHPRGSDSARKHGRGLGFYRVQSARSSRQAIHSRAVERRGIGRVGRTD